MSLLAVRLMSWRRSRLQYDDTESGPLSESHTYRRERESGYRASAGPSSRGKEWSREPRSWRERRDLESHSWRSRDRYRERRENDQGGWRRDREHSPRRSRESHPYESRSHEQRMREPYAHASRALSSDSAQNSHSKPYTPPTETNADSTTEPDADQIAAMMGFGNFGSSKVGPHDGNASHSH